MIDKKISNEFQNNGVVLLKKIIDQKWIEEANATFVMNSADNYAIEEAMQIKEKLGDGEVVIVCMGPRRVQKVIREGLSKGADRGIHIETPNFKNIDPLKVAKNI